MKLDVAVMKYEDFMMEYDGNWPLVQHFESQVRPGLEQANVIPCGI
jgi:hypothetical protein